MIGGKAERSAQRVGEVPARVVPFLRGLGHGFGYDLIDGDGQSGRMEIRDGGGSVRCA